ncbi:GNAT family N-acetyltransferase [Moheibacter sediminis]|uniref:Protein N-acetyltransferase, RimJ/RimL family n=1 Tax=Moheibacter sediminis TaxID=1434700 RepID=A0A1W2BQI6_9FLAO|nr:GNAT family N-acetyltransferase [Moheibacter sediminis]SMC75086.1 Protein N-acetyltransferase, RimJ/RimL family [Moheibacter sediminis]
MKNILQTPRLILREFHIDDAEYFFKLNSNPKVIQFTGDEAFKNIEEAKNFLSNYKNYEQNGYGRWSVIDKKTNHFLGWCGLNFNGNETDIGFRFFEEHWNKGYATESAKACLDFGFKILDLNEIVGRAMKENSASHKVLEKIGLSFSHEIEKENYKWVIYKIQKN